ncbi:GumC family protein [Enterovirga sp.]|jgi:uncharacterized protein involved in exopolysaccharide biosynthesis|uniref:GumC family protein n=1 Tax=Enterovirga sp. TaxID=2026350 RepID=UPI0026179B5C|nr:GumC family protein [Enterovirga sp.]MDB5591868.1 hypothetical protein [Enterovirga sp.]
MRNLEQPAFGAELYQSDGPPPRAAAASAFPGDAKSLWTALVTRKGTILAVFGAAMLLALAYIWMTPPLYTATAEIIIDPRKRDMVDKEIVQSGLGTSSLGPDTFLLDSQVQVMLSQNVLRGLIEQTDLVSDPEFVGTSRSAFANRAIDLLKLLVRGPQADSIARTSDYERALANLLQRLDIKRKGNTYVFAVSVRSESAARAAEIANGLVALYTEEVNRSARARVEGASRLLDARLDELRQKVSESRDKVETYRNAHGLISTERLTVIEQQLRDLNLQLARVSTAANAARSRWQEAARLQKMTAEQALASGLVESAVLTALRERAAAITVEEGSLSMTLMQNHPALVAVRESRAALQRSIQAEIRRVIARIKHEHDVSTSEESSLRTRIAGLEKAIATTNRASVTLQELLREADANAALYEQFLGRAKSAREQINIPSETVSLISKAFPPTRPSWPAEPLILGFAALLGLALGGLAAVWLGLRPRRTTKGHGVRPLRQPISAAA